MGLPLLQRLMSLVLPFRHGARLGSYAYEEGPIVQSCASSQLTPKRCVTAEYLYLWLLNMPVVGVGTTQQQLTVPMFKAYDIKVPEAKAMEQFSQTINPLFDAIDSNKEECIKLAALRDVLLPRLMSGEIDVQKVAIGCGLLH